MTEIVNAAPVLVYIASFINPTRLSNFRLTCSSFSASTNDDSLWRLYIKLYCCIPPKEKQEIQIGKAQSFFKNWYKNEFSRFIVSVRVQLNGMGDDFVCEGNTIHARENGTMSDFKFDNVLENVSQEAMYNAIAEPMLQYFVSGYNTAVFSYGDAVCGKSYTMFGSSTPGADLESGIVPRFTKQLFNYIHNSADIAENSSVMMASLMYYNCIIHDTNNKFAKVKLNQKQNTVEGDFQRVEINSADNAMQVFTSCNNEISRFFITQWNSTPARASRIIILYLKNGEHENSMFFVDLANSPEGGFKTTGSRIYMTLSQVLRALIKKSKNKQTHVPYRDSPVTRLAMHALGGNCKTFIINTRAPDFHNTAVENLQLGFVSQFTGIQNSISPLRFAKNCIV